MSYAIRKDNRGWRAVSSPDEITADERYSKTQPVHSAESINDAQRETIGAKRDRHIDAPQVNGDTAASDGAWDVASGRAAAAPLPEAARDTANAQLFRQIGVIADAVRRAIADNSPHAAEHAYASPNDAPAGAISSYANGEAAVTESAAQRANNPEDATPVASGMHSAAVVRFQRNQLIDALQWRIEHYQRQMAAAIITDDTDTIYGALLACVQALRDAPV